MKYLPKVARWSRITIPRSIRGKILLACLGMSAITGAIGLWGTLEILTVGKLGIETYDRPLMAINYVRAAHTMFEQMGNPELEGKVYSPDSLNPEESFLSDLDVAEDRASSPKTAANVRNVRTLARSWLWLRNAPPSPEHTAIVARVSNQLRQEFERLTERMADDGYHNRKVTAHITMVAYWASLGLTILAVLVSITVAVLMSRRIVRPLSSATEAANRIAAGEFQTPIPEGDGDEAGALLGSMTVMQQRLREMMSNEEARRRSAEGRLIEALESSQEAMMLLDRDGTVLIANSRVTQLLSLPGQCLKPGDKFAAVVAGGDAECAIRLCMPGETQLRNGIWVKVSREETGDGNSFLTWSDITAQKTYERKLHAAAYEDPLTGLKNRAGFLEYLPKLPASEHAIVLLNLDRFRQINSTYGTQAADQLLGHVASYLKLLLKPQDICARIAADEFVIVVNAKDAAHLEKLTVRLTHAFPMTRRIGERTVTVAASIGIAHSDAEMAGPNDLLAAARAALDLAKRGGGRVKLFDTALRDETRSRQRVEADLPDAILRREIVLNYQPLVDLKTGHLAGFEALARWKHPELGFIPPTRFIPIAEESASILDLGKYVLDSAAGQAKSWAPHRMFGRDFTVAVNLSPRQLADPTNAKQILNYLDRDPAAARLLKLEVTEGLLLDDPIGMAILLKQFKERGVELSLDDFGTGYSSLSYLHRFPFDVLKIDRSFVTEIAEKRDALRLVQTIIELGKDLGLTLVAEGIETPEHAQILADLGCDIGQGYYFSRPVDPMTAATLLNKRYDWSVKAEDALNVA